MNARYVMKQENAYFHGGIVASVVDTAAPDTLDYICECYSEDAAQRVADALNAADAAGTKGTVMTADDALDAAAEGFEEAARLLRAGEDPAPALDAVRVKLGVPDYIETVRDWRAHRDMATWRFIAACGWLGFGIAAVATLIA